MSADPRVSVLVALMEALGTLIDEGSAAKMLRSIDAAALPPDPRLGVLTDCVESLFGEDEQKLRHDDALWMLECLDLVDPLRAHDDSVMEE